MKSRPYLVLLGLLVLALVAPTCGPASASRAVAARIIRDSYGVPHIYADNAYDLFYANGYAVAQDRLSQLELYRRAGLGRLAEMMGSSYLETDMDTRHESYTLVERDAMLKALPVEQQRILEAYTDGINARLAEVRADASLMPWDLSIQGVTPADWQVDDCVAILLYMGRTFGEYGGAGGNELNNQSFYQHLVETFGSSQGAAIFNDVVPIEDPAAATTIQVAPPAGAAGVQVTRSPLAVESDLLEDAQAREARVRQARESIGVPTKLGSFWWAITGARSSTGRALLFGGPQMGYATPNVGHEISLHGAGFDVRGMSVAGVPGVLIGYNGRLAWSITSGFSDQVDVYVETLDPADPSRYWQGGAWHVMEQRTETYQVKGGAPVTETIWRTVHGPVFAVDPTSHTALSERRAHWGQELAAWQAWLQFNALGTVAAGLEAIETLPLSLNFLFADQDGHIGYRQAGRQPVRASGFDPRMPLPGTGEAEWIGFLAPEDMPHVVDPAGGALGNWNNKPMPGWPNGDAVNWGAVDRVQRIFTRLGGNAPMSPEMAKDLAPDIGRNDYRADALLPYLLDALAVPGVPADGRLPQVKQILSDWDHRADDGAVGESIFNAWRTQVFSDTLGDELGAFLVPLQDWFNPVGDSLLLRALQGPAASLPVVHDYFDGIEPETALVESLSAALDSLTSSYGTSDMTQWKFDPGTIDFTLGPAVVARIPWYSRGSYMQFIELTRPLARGINILPPGQSGTVLVGSDGYVHADPHYLDQVELARTWQYKSMPLYYPAALYLPLIVKLE